MCPDSQVTYYTTLNTHLKRKQRRVIVGYREDLNEVIIITENRAKVYQNKKERYCCYIGALKGTEALTIFRLVQNQKEIEAADVLRRNFEERQASIIIENIGWSNLWTVLPETWGINEQRLQYFLGSRETDAVCIGHMLTYYVLFTTKYTRLQVIIGFRTRSNNTMVFISDHRKRAKRTAERYSYYVNAIEYEAAKKIYDAIKEENKNAAVSLFKEHFHKEKSTRCVMNVDLKRYEKSIPIEWIDDSFVDLHTDLMDEIEASVVRKECWQECGQNCTTGYISNSWY